MVMLSGSASVAAGQVESADPELARERGVRVNPETKRKKIESKKIVV